ncbi:MAG: peptidoglycan bridge formation glycyltransferase FemA/FemB family protein [Ornithinimicrobium sp.]|uniref:lipid II:glycine glycyltransferase FemX n=1 Tax=Ornithinimicrobium sp. TaxID=1977084 RepID=UPI0026DFF994|nr:peptidoglycan bridge formation glycyltransferase FemA/FemB family protein [Ornithinimicrobium sp.]MDO5739207.1 peptidoglycan bridge formation glycyltransferase FemA/FemB family protein [Ornithinimicrobium sp.]
MTVRDASAEEKAQWDELIWDTPGGPDLMQLEPYAQLKAGAWGSHRQLIHEHPGKPDIPALYLIKKLPPFGQLWYAPMGPRVTDPEHLQLIIDDLRSNDAFAVILEPSIPVDGPQARSELIASTPGLEDFLSLQQGNHTVLVDLRPSEEDLLASFRQRARRSIRKAEGARIEHRTDDEAFEIFWDLYALTVERAGLPMRPKHYYLNAWKHYRDLGQGHVVFGYSSPEVTEPEAAAYIWAHRDRGYYRDGGSVRTPAANGLQYRVQWEAMRWCKERGATTYDLFGVPPSWELENSEHQLHGLVQFKTAFGQVTDTVGTMRLNLRPRRTAAWDRFGFKVYQRVGRKSNPLFY